MGQGSDWVKTKTNVKTTKKFLNIITKTNSCQNWVELLNKRIVLSKDINYLSKKEKKRQTNWLKYAK